MDMEGIDLIIKALRDKLPIEAIGFVLGAGVLILFIMLAFFLRRYQHIEPPREAINAPITDDTTFTGRMRARAAKVATMPGKILKDKLKTRETAMVMGFIVDEVERDLPSMEKDKDKEAEAKAGLLERMPCGRYYFPEHVTGGAEWKLLRRPSQTMPAPLLLTPGWILQMEKGELPHLAIGAINHLIADKHWQKHVVEIEVKRNSIHFYWDEFGGKEKLEAFKTLVEKLNQRSV